MVLIRVFYSEQGTYGSSEVTVGTWWTTEIDFDHAEDFRTWCAWVNFVNRDDEKHPFERQLADELPGFKNDPRFRYCVINHMVR